MKIKSGINVVVSHAFTDGTLVVLADGSGQVLLVPQAVAEAAGAYPVAPGQRLAVEADGDRVTTITQVLAKSIGRL